MLPPMSAVAHHAKSAIRLRTMSSCFFFCFTFLWLDKRVLEVCKRVFVAFFPSMDLLLGGVPVGPGGGDSTTFTVELLPASSGTVMGFVVGVGATLDVAVRACDVSAASTSSSSTTSCTIIAPL